MWRPSFSILALILNGRETTSLSDGTPSGAPSIIISKCSKLKADCSGELRILATSSLLTQDISRARHQNAGAVLLINSNFLDLLASKNGSH
jgi:hypothetical protein